MIINYKKYFNNAMKNVVIDVLKVLTVNDIVSTNINIILKIIPSHACNIIPDDNLHIEEDYITIQISPQTCTHIKYNNDNQLLYVSLNVDAKVVFNYIIHIDSIVSFIDTKHEIMIELDPIIPVLSQYVN